MHKQYCFDENNYISVIPEAIKDLEAEFKAMSIGKKTVSSRLILCEELLLCYGENGYKSFSMKIAKRPFSLVLIIRIEGEKKNIFDTDSFSRGQNSQEEIHRAVRNKILETGSVWAEYRYHKNINEVQIILSDNDEVLTDKILNLYNERPDDLQKKPLLLIGQLIKWDPVRSIGSILNRLIKHSVLLLIPVCIATLIDRTIEKDQFFSAGTLMLFLCILLLIMTNGILTLYFDRILYCQKSREIEMGIKGAALKKLEYLSMDYLNQLSSGKILSKVIKDVEGIRTFIKLSTGCVVPFFGDIIIIICVTLLRCPAMLLFYITTIPIVALLIYKFRIPIRKRTEYLRKSSEKTAGVIRDMQDMQQLTRLHGLQKAESQILTNQLLKEKRAGDEYDKSFLIFSTFTFFTFQFFKLVCLVFAIILATNGIISVGLVVLFESYFESLVNSISKILEQMPDMIKGFESLSSVNEILCADNHEKNGTIMLSTDMKGEIEFKDVVMRYSGSDRPVINHLSFKIPAGKSVAFVGESGSGKTTIINLITGLFEKESGQILIDGNEIDDLDKESYRKRISVVPQSTVLFTGTLWDNLVYGKDYIITEEIMSVIKMSGLAQFINSLPNGLDSTVQEGGKNFSGGQRQRISIARALLRKPKIMFFDEATSALDQESENQVQEAIDSLMGSCTIIIVAHRLSTVRKCDYIMKLEPDGSIHTFNSYQSFMEAEIKEI